MVELFAILVLAAHLLAVNVASTGPLVGAWLDWREGRGHVVAGRVGRRILWWSITALVLGGLLGVVVGWTLWDGGYRVALHRLRSKVYYGAAEYAFSLVLMLLQAWFWQRGWGSSRRGRMGRGVLAGLASSNLLYHFPLLLSIFARIVSGLDAGDEALTAADFRARIVEPEVVARCLHFWLACAAVGGCVLMAAAVREWADTAGGSSVAAGEVPLAESTAGSEQLIVWGARIALVPTLLQVLSGTWLLMQLEPLAQSRLLGGDALASLTLLVGLALALSLMHRLAAAAMGTVSRRGVQATFGLLILLILLMTATLRQIDRPHRPAPQPAESSLRELSADDRDGSTGFLGQVGQIGKFF